MQQPWLELLSGLDVMVLGSIVGSVMLAFVLIVVIFSLRIKTQQEQMVLLHQDLEEKHRQATLHQREIANLKKKIEEKETVVKHYQDVEKQLNQSTTAIREELNTTAVTTRMLRDEIVQHEKENRALLQALKTCEAEREEARNETRTALKRNEHWVEQIAQLRARHEALKHKFGSSRGGVT